MLFGENKVLKLAVVKYEHSEHNLATKGESLFSTCR